MISSFKFSSQISRADYTCFGKSYYGKCINKIAFLSDTRYIYIFITYSLLNVCYYNKMYTWI